MTQLPVRFTSPTGTAQVPVSPRPGGGPIRSGRMGSLGLWPGPAPAHAKPAAAATAPMSPATRHPAASSGSGGSGKAKKGHRRSHR